MSFVMYEVPITIRKSWFFPEVNPVFPWEFHLHPQITMGHQDCALPGVEFTIFAKMLAGRKMNVRVSKTPCHPAYVTIRILIDEVKKCEKTIDDWRTDCEFNQIYIGGEERQGVTKTNFKCEIKWFRSLKEIPRVGLYRSMKELYDTQEFTDFEIMVDDEAIPVHKLIFAAQSPVFLTMFKTDMKESKTNRLVVNDIRVDVMKKVIEFMYTGVLDTKLDHETVLSILSVADRYQISDLKHFCAGLFSMKLEVNNALEMYEMAVLYGLSEFVESITKFMVQKKNQIVKLADFEDFCRKKPELMVELLLAVLRHENNSKQRRDKYQNDI